MKVLCEAMFPCFIEERYARHQFVERLMKQGADIPRTYTWSSGDCAVKVRSMTEATEQWRPVIAPSVGTLFRFTLDAHVRCGFPLRKSNVDYLDNLEWIERTGEKVGLKLRGIDFDPIKVSINHRQRAFIKNASRFRGLALMQDTEAFMRALAFGIGDAKTFGFGFLMFAPLRM